MPQLNKGFSKSKMNKDMDERVVASGEYRDALNIQISSSDGSDVGSAQTLLGNTLVSSGVVPEGSKCVGSIAHNKEDKIYYFVAGPKYNQGDEEGCWKDYIIEYDLKKDAFKYVFVDIYRVHLKTTGVSSNRDISIASSSPDIRSVRRDMNINGYDSNGNHIIYSNDSHLTEVISIGTPPNTINIYSSSVDYNTTSVPSGTLLKIKPKNQVLRFNRAASTNNLITGINIVDGMLFWTDNYSEPKKINIKRSIAGTGGSVALPPANNVFGGDTADYHTRLCITPDSHNELRVKVRSGGYPTGIPWYAEEENVTVIKKGPLKSPSLIMSQHEDGRNGHNTFSETDGSASDLSGPPTGWAATADNSFTYIVPDTVIRRVKKPGDEIKNVYVANPVNWKVGDLVMFNQQQDINSAEGFTDHDVRATVTSVPTSAPSKGPYDFMIESIDAQAIDEEQKVWNLRLVEKPPMFEQKFVRFGYRYKYEDGEYSTFSPWSEPAFIAGEYDYLPKKGYNLGMTNRLRQLKVTNYVTEDMPRDVVEIDILFKNEASPNIYKVETIKSTDGWSVKGERLWPDKINFEIQTGLTSSLVTSGSGTDRGEYEVTSELIHSTVPSNQLLRPYDNLPRVALAQEVTSNRLVYGNYVQNFNLVNDAANTEVKPIINVVLSTKDTPLNAPEGTSDEALNGEDNAEGFAIPRKTCRSLRTYQVGVVYGDRFGRETPVLAGAGGSGSLTIDVKNSSTQNKLRVDIGSYAPSFAHYYKFYVKETSNEYYNLAMDRWYDAEDGNVWLSFASADRNKLDLETHITLKKKHDKHEPVTDKARYKILAIENSAPKFIKTNIKILGAGKDNGDKNRIGTSGMGFPMKDYNEMWIKTAASGVDKWFNQSVSELMPFINDGTLFIRVRTLTIKSNWYQVTKLNTQSSGWYKFTTDKFFSEDVDFTTTDGTYDNRVSGLRIELARHVVEDKKEFEGRFFVKIYKDLVLIHNLLRAVEPQYRVTQASKIGYWNIPKGSYSGIIGGDMVNWEHPAITNNGRVDENSNSTSGTTLFAGHGGTGKRRAFFFKTATNGWQDSSEWGCSAREATKKWMSKSEGKFHIDASWVRGAKKCNGYGSNNGCSRSSFKKDCWRENTRGLGITNGGKSMDIGYVHNGGSFNNWKDENDKLFITALKNVGANFRFREDPDGVIYTVTGAKGASGDDSRYGKHHTWHAYTSKGYGNNKSRWRIDFERADMPGVGLGQGPSKYHPIGPRATTKNPAIAELGFYGGRHGTEGWQLTANNGLDDQRRVPAPDGFAVSQMRAGAPAYANSITGTSTTGIEQARLYRTHTARFHHIEIVEPMDDEDGDWSSKNPAVWETEPKEDVGMDIYYEASPALPIKIDAWTNELFAPYGSLVKNAYSGIGVPEGTVVVSWSDNKVTFSNPITITNGTGHRIQFVRPDGFTTSAIMNEGTGSHSSVHVRPYDVAPAENNNHSDAPHNQPVTLSWYNAFTFGNGIESDRIRDDFNQVTIANGVKASTVMATTYKQERRAAGLIHSGIYNSTSGVNNLNQFIAAEKITKDMNPVYGSIQKLYTRDGDIVVFHEDKVMKVLADKDALFNADGKKNVAISSNFLGTDSPFATTYGISTNPESFATDLSGRAYFSDRSKSAILRLSNSGIDNISNYGMKDWFNDHLNPETTQVLGSFDQKKGIYNVTITGKVLDANDDTVIEDAVEVGGVCDCESDKDVEVLRNSIVVPFKKTISFSEKSKGWISFKSFLPENALSINNNYYSFKDGQMYIHHDNSLRNNFYGEQFDSSITLLFNDNPAAVKSFATINYEGSQARINSNTTDNLYNNLNSKNGWYIENMITNLQECDNIEFKEKEGKWFGFVKGSSTSLANLNQSEFSVQGIGVAKTVVGEGDIPTVCLTITPNINCGEISGCTDPLAINYNVNANVDDGSCTYPPEPVYGCTDPNANNYYASATDDDGSCEYSEEDPCVNFDCGGITVFTTQTINPTLSSPCLGNSSQGNYCHHDGSITWTWGGQMGLYDRIRVSKNKGTGYHQSQYTGDLALNSTLSPITYDAATNTSSVTWSGLNNNGNTTSDENFDSNGYYRIIVYKHCSLENLQGQSSFGDPSTPYREEYAQDNYPFPYLENASSNINPPVASGSCAYVGYAILQLV